MKGITIFSVLLITFLFSCKEKKQDDHSHNEESENIQLIGYSKEWEIFAEANHFVQNHPSQILSHITHIPSFKPVKNATISLQLIVQGKTYSQVIKEPLREGIYLFSIHPEVTGTGYLVYNIQTDSGSYQVRVPGVKVFEDEDKASSATAKTNNPNYTTFTKEQSWKVDFASGYPESEMFGQVVKSSCRIQSFPEEEKLITAPSDGVVVFNDKSIFPGMAVSSGDILFSVSGIGINSENSMIFYQEARNNYEKARSDYERNQALWKDKIVSEKDWLIVKNDYLNAKNLWENINKNFSETGQKILAPMQGCINEILVKNGESVKVGQKIASVSSNKYLLLVPEVPLRYYESLSNLNEITLKKSYDNKVYTLQELKGVFLSIGRSAEHNGNLIPVYIKIEGSRFFVPGEWVEVWLKTTQNEKSLTLPNSALIEEQGLWYVYRQITPELFEKKEVKTGASDGLKTEITEGLNPDERVVLRGAVYIKLAQATGNLDAHSGHVH